MHPVFVAILAHPVTAGALSGWASAALVDYGAFRTWRSFADARAYAWDVAVWRWLQGAIGGAVAAWGWSAT